MSERFKSSVLHETDYGTFVRLTCHFKFEHASKEERFNPIVGGGKPICNGCGPSGYGAVVPDSILGVNISICGHIHNWGYQFGVDHEDKAIIDETFKDNMDRLIRDRFETDIIKLEGGKFVKIRSWNAKRVYHARLIVAEKAYYNAVRVFGGSAFWDKRKVNISLADIS